MQRSALRVEPFRAGAWAALQVVAYAACVEAGLALAATFHDWRPDLGRGLFWWYYLVGFAGLALAANLLLEVPRIGRSAGGRLAVWGGVFAALGAYALASWSSLPLAVPFVHGCALLAVVLREALGRWFAGRARRPTPA